MVTTLDIVPLEDIEPLPRRCCATIRFLWFSPDLIFRDPVICTTSFPFNWIVRKRLLLPFSPLLPQRYVPFSGTFGAGIPSFLWV